MHARRWGHALRLLAAVSSVYFLLGCGADDSRPVLIVDHTLHLEDHVDAASVRGSESAADPVEALEWRFVGPESGWKPAPSWNPAIGNATLELVGDAMRVTLDEQTTNPNGIPAGGVHISVPDLLLAEWSDVVVRARGNGSVTRIAIGLNLRPGRGPATSFPTRSNSVQPMHRSFVTARSRRIAFG